MRQVIRLSIGRRICVRRRTLEPATLMREVAHAFRSRLNSGEYDNMKQEVDRAWHALHCRSQSKPAVRDTDPAAPSDEDTPTRHCRLDLDTIVKHFQSKGPSRTFLASVCKHKLDDNQTADVVYVMPKYRLRNAVEKTEEMYASMRLAVATTAAEVQEACADPETGMGCHGVGAASCIEIHSTCNVTCNHIIFIIYILYS